MMKTSAAATQVATIARKQITSVHSKTDTNDKSYVYWDNWENAKEYIVPEEP
jgi:hypothetical protein